MVNIAFALVVHCYSSTNDKKNYIQLSCLIFKIIHLLSWEVTPDIIVEDGDPCMTILHPVWMGAMTIEWCRKNMQGSRASCATSFFFSIFFFICFDSFLGTESTFPKLKVHLAKYSTCFSTTHQFSIKKPYLSQNSSFLFQN